MTSCSDFLFTLRSLAKLYELYLEEVRTQYQLSCMEITIMGFLHNNPGHDTATDIVEMRMLQKGNVSLAVEQLIQKSYLMRTPDAKDRRRIHLSLTDNASPIVNAIERQNEKFYALAYSGFTAQEQETYARLNQHLQQNIQSGLEEGDYSNETGK